MEQVKDIINKPPPKIGKARSAFTTSPRAEEILRIVRQYEGKISKREIYHKVIKLDKNLPTFQSFLTFLTKLNKDRQKRVGFLLNDLRNKNLPDKDLLQNMQTKLYSLGDVIVDEEIKEAYDTLQKGESLNKNDRKRVMEWVFRSADLEQKRRIVDLQVKADERAESFLDNLLAAAQYGKLKEQDIAIGEFEEIKTSSV